MPGPVVHESTQANSPAVRGTNDTGTALLGASRAGTGVIGTSESAVGAWGGSTSSSGVGGMSQTGIGVHGVSTSGPGVRGDCAGGDGVFGVSETSNGVHGVSVAGTGVIGTSESGVGSWGGSASSSGVGGMSRSGIGVHGVSQDGPGVRGDSTSNAGLLGISSTGEAVRGESRSPNLAAIAAVHLNPDGIGAALYAQKEGTVGHAGVFRGNVLVRGTIEVTGDIVLPNADCAEYFDAVEGVEPGTVVVLNDAGGLCPSATAYDRRVAGVISGAGDLRPGLLLDGDRKSMGGRPVALMGKVWCKVDAQYGDVEVGDLLTTSPTPGHAMRAADPGRAFGAVLGKALHFLRGARVDLVPVLVALQ